MLKSYKELIVWQKAMDLAIEVYRLSKSFPREETYALTGQIRRSVISIPSNIAEEQARNSTAEFKNFLSIAQGSLAETETQLILAIRLNYLKETDAQLAISLREEVSKMLTSLKSKLGTDS